MFTENHSKYYPVGSRRADFSQSSLFGSQLPITHRAPIDRAFFVNSDLTKLRRRRQRERQKKTTTTNNRISEQKATLHVHHTFLYISLQSLHNDVKWPNFKFTWERGRQGDKFYHLCQNSGRVRSPLFSSNPNSLLLSNWASWNNHGKKWKDAKSIFQRRFHGRRRCRIVSSDRETTGDE